MVSELLQLQICHFMEASQIKHGLWWHAYHDMLIIENHKQV